MTTLEYPEPVNVNFDVLDEAISFMRALLPSRKILHRIICQNSPDNKPRKVSPYRHHHKELGKVIQNLLKFKKDTIRIINHNSKVLDAIADTMNKLVIKKSKKKLKIAEEIAKQYKLIYKP